MEQKEYKEIAGINKARLTHWKNRLESSHNSLEIDECNVVIRELITLFKLQADYFERGDIKQAIKKCEDCSFKDRIQDYRKFSKVKFLKDCGVNKQY